MKCDEAIRDILLDSSGELEPVRRPSLTAHLERCASCRAYRDTLSRVETVARSEARAEEVVSAVTADTILTEITRRSMVSAHATRARWLAHPAWSVAAAMVVAFLVGFTAAVLRASFRPNGSTAMSTAAPPTSVWTLDEWMDLQLDLLSDEAAALARELQRPVERPPEPAQAREDETDFNESPADA
ncbi:MAG: hypothetical protein N2652_00065 [Kiritimatiellae bacterium]|nr:hypothetical protein [Kiritimatiellia bacterium]